MLLAGVSLRILINNNYEESTHTTFHNFFERARDTFKQLHTDTQFYSEELSVRNEIRNSINLISEYSDINDYQANIYDDEKKNIARQIFNYAKSTQLYEIRVYDKRGWLAAFARPNADVMGIVSFLKAKPVLYISDAKNVWKVNSNKQVFPALRIEENINATDSYYIKYQGIVGVESTKKITRTFSGGIEKNIGYVKVSNPISESVLNKLSKGSSARHSIILSDRKILGDDISELPLETLKSFPSLFNPEFSARDKISIYHNDYFLDGYSIPLSSGNNFYLVSSLSKKIINSQIIVIFTH